jgi:hypothetical protein
MRQRGGYLRVGTLQLDDSVTHRLSGDPSGTAYANATFDLLPMKIHRFGGSAQTLADQFAGQIFRDE